MQKARLSADGVNTAMVRRVGQRLADAVVTYLNSNGMGGDVSQYKWEFNLVQDSNVNAFCMPGGKIVVYDGLLPVTRDEASLAIVLGHEIAHAVARHSAERLSNQVKQQYGSQILGTVLSGAGASTSLQQIGSTVFGLGSTLGSAAVFAQAGERGRPSRHHLCRHGRLRSAGGHSILAAHGLGYRRWLVHLQRPSE